MNGERERGMRGEVGVGVRVNMGPSESIGGRRSEREVILSVGCPLPRCRREGVLRRRACEPIAERVRAAIHEYVNKS